VCLKRIIHRYRTGVRCTFYTEKISLQMFKCIYMSVIIIIIFLYMEKSTVFFYSSLYFNSTIILVSGQKEAQALISAYVYGRLLVIFLLLSWFIFYILHQSLPFYMSMVMQYDMPMVCLECNVYGPSTTYLSMAMFCIYL
jgi:hypothetical protein